MDRRVHGDDEDHAFVWSRTMVAAQSSSKGGTVTDGLQRVCRAVPDGLGLAGAAVILSSGTDTEIVPASSDPTSAALAEIELSLGEGPSRDAMRAGRPVLVDDLLRDRRVLWVAYAAAAATYGIGSVFAFPLHVGAARFGTLTMYGGSSEPLGDLRASRSLALAEMATETLLAGPEAPADWVESLDATLDLRNEIYQAQGMVMVALGTDLATALARMRAHAFFTDRSLLEVSLDIVAGRLILTEERTDT